MLTNIGEAPLVEADASRPKWKSSVDPQLNRTDDLTSLYFSAGRLWAFILLIEVAVGYGVLTGYKALNIAGIIAAQQQALQIVAYVALAIGVVVTVLFVGLASFAAYMYTLARLRTPATGEPSKFLTFHKPGLEAKWAGKPMPVEVRPGPRASFSNPCLGCHQPAARPPARAANCSCFPAPSQCSLADSVPGSCPPSSPPPPAQTMYEAYFAGELEFKGDVLETLRNHRRQFVAFRFNLSHLKFFVTQWVPELLAHTKAQDESQVREHYDRGSASPSLLCVLCAGVSMSICTLA